MVGRWVTEGWGEVQGEVRGENPCVCVCVGGGGGGGGGGGRFGGWVVWDGHGFACTLGAKDKVYEEGMTGCGRAGSQSRAARWGRRVCEAR